MVLSSDAENDIRRSLLISCCIFVGCCTMLLAIFFGGGLNKVEKAGGGFLFCKLKEDANT